MRKSWQRSDVIKNNHIIPIDGGVLGLRGENNMKKYLFLIFIVSLIGQPVHAEFKGSVLWSLPKSENLEAHPVYQLEYSLHKNLSLYGSYEKMLVRYAGQEAYDVTIGGLGFKGEKEIGGDIKLILTIGGFFPTVDRRGASSEALSYEMNRTVGTGNVAKQEDNYSIELKNAIGGSISIVMPVSKCNVTVGYQFLKFEEIIMARANHFSPGHWEIFMHRDYSGPFFGLIYPW